MANPKKQKPNVNVKDLEQLVFTIQTTNEYFLRQVQKQVNTALTFRNWVIGYCIVEYEQKGTDRAKYGTKLLHNLATKLKSSKLKGFGETNLKLFRTFYLLYPQIRQTLSDEFTSQFKNLIDKGQTPSDKSKINDQQKDIEISKTDAKTLISQLSFSHFIELIKAEDPLKRTFYETQAIENTWSVRELQRAMNSMLFERTGLSNNKKLVFQSHKKDIDLKPEDVFRNPYMLEFLGLEERPLYSELELEAAIISHLQNFLLEMGRGFCFETRQKRITFDNTHYRIDLVFYHRILRCHVLIDLKLGDFDHADAGQMNVYLNYYKENEMQKGDNLPLGIILCAGKNETLVKYATSGLAQKVFVTKYMINLPSEKQLKAIIEEEQLKLQ